MTATARPAPLARDARSGPGRVGRWAAVLALAGACVPATGEEVARDAAKSVIGRTVATRLPGLPVQPAVDCLVDNATTEEVLALASDTVTGPTAATTETVLAIASRPGTLNCLAVYGATMPT